MNAKLRTRNLRLRLVYMGLNTRKQSRGSDCNRFTVTRDCVGGDA